MSYLKAILSDLRERRIWPLAVVLLVAIVAVPTVLSKPAAKVPAAPSSNGSASAGGPVAGLPVVTVTGAVSHSRLKGHARDPFTQSKLHLATAAANTVTTPATTGGALGSTGSGGTSTTGGGGTTTPSGTTTPGGTTTTTTTPGGTPVPTGKPKPAPAGLSADESYEIQISITDAAGGVDTIDPLQRLGLLPSNQRPMLVNLGVLRGGGRVLFAVVPGTFLRGPGTCTPGPIDCQVLSLGQDQVETLFKQTAGGMVNVGQFAVTGIRAQKFASSSAAQKARTKVSTLGRRILGRLDSPALSLFPFKPNLGAVVDLRDLKVGGN